MYLIDYNHPYFEITRFGANVYKYDDIKTEILGVIQKGDSVKVIGVPLNNLTYIPIFFNNRKGYILYSNIKIQNSINIFKDSILSRIAILEKIKDSKKRENDSIQKIIDYEKHINSRKKCEFEINEVDKFDNKTKKNLNRKLIYGNKIEFIQVQPIKINNSTYLRIFSSGVGCASPYDNNKSYIKFKLKNKKIVTVYHIGEVNCDGFSLFGRLTANDILNLKSSPLETIRISGTEFYNDLENLDWESYFQDQLGCLN